MPIYRTQVQIQTADNTAANYATNTWHCSAPDLVELALWEAALLAFYTAVDGLFSNQVKQTGNNVYFKHYDLADPEPRAPVLEGPAAISPTALGGLPPEVALVMSFQAPKTSGVPQARRRNRIYLPFMTSNAGGSDGRPQASTLTTVVGAATTLLAASGPTSADWQWMVYSPTDDAIDLVDNGWVDNEWDTQRRRGRKATTRSTF